MSTQHIAKTRVVKVAVGSDSGNRVARILFAGDIVPDGVDDEQLTRLVERGLIEKVEAEEEDLPEGDPTDKWTGPQLKRYATDNGIDIGTAKNKADVLAAIAAHSAN